MTNTIKILAIAIIFLLSSFTNKNADGYIGTYGVSSLDPAQIRLVINSDHTFYYQDFSVSDKKIVVEGNWTLKGEKIVLENNNSGRKFHNVWSFTEDGQIAKSRKGLTFYKLSKISG